MANNDDPGGFSWAETPDGPRSSWARIVIATLVVGLAIGILVAIAGFIVLRVYG